MAVVLSVLDYMVIVAMLVVSAGIGIFFAVRAGRRQSSRDYFLGSQKMSVVPVSFSLAATVVSAITYLGTPAEVYMHGPKFAAGLLSRVHTPLIIAFFFVPVFYRLKLTTMYEYLGLRFSNTVRYSVVCIKFLHEFLYMGIVIYTPALALSLVAGISLPFSILSVGVICTFYTSVGGIKAVIWTDVFQALSMLIGATVMIIVGTARIGGAAEGMRRAVEGGRGDLTDFSIDPTIRFTFWNTVIGGTFSWLYLGGSTQSLIQRYNSCRTEREAKLASWLGMIGMALIELLAITTGMTAFAYYYNCDPLTSGQMSRSDQIIPFFIMDLFHSYPGVPGVLIAGAFSASLSSMSSVLNGIVATVGQDGVKMVWPNLSDFRYSIIVKIISFVLGALAIVLAFLASVLGDVLKTSISLGGVMGGPVLGVFILGMFFPRANTEGAIAGMVGGVIIGIVQFTGAQMFPPPRLPPPLSVDGCMVGINMTYSIYTTDAMYNNSSTLASTAHGWTYGRTSSIIPEPSNSENQPQGSAFFSLSYLWLPALTTSVCVVLGLIVSYVVSWKNPRVVDPRCLTPLVARYYTNMESDVDFKEEERQDKDYVSLKKV